MHANMCHVRLNRTFYYLGLRWHLENCSVSLLQVPSDWKKCKKLTWASEAVFEKLNLNKDIL